LRGHTAALRNIWVQLKKNLVGMPFAAHYNLDMQHLDVEGGFPISKTLPVQSLIQRGKIRVENSPPPTT
jgi:hypothetical protein